MVFVGLWASSGLPVASQHFVGNGVLEAEGDVVVGVVRLWPSFQSFENIK